MMIQGLRFRIKKSLKSMTCNYF
uniref:Uncharacterized protein n=1 Tax=Rhizophora mucronata TaxID=61149 RepID=A0A2P2J3J5_RHIMU